jgi:hypothetical protein
MSNFDEILEQVFQQIVADNAMTPEQLSEAAGSIANDVMDQIADQMRKDLRRRAPSTLRNTRRETAGFERRNLQRWRKPFNLIEMILEIAAEVGGKFNTEIRPLAIQEKDYLFEALTHLHARALLVGSECICLMKGGFADGALSRWRTLHELNAVAAFLAKNDKEVALRYLVSFEFQALTAARQMKKYADRSKMDPPTDDEIAAIESRCKAHLNRFGEDIRHEYGWASGVIGKKAPNLLDIEEFTGLDHWRPRFKWASQHTHGGHRPFGTMLGTAESKAPVLLIGQSNSGLVDPLHMTAISLTHITASLLLSRPDTDRLICTKVLMGLSDDVGREALKVDRAPPPKPRRKVGENVSPVA